jgi:hypothetical protein
MIEDGHLLLKRESDHKAVDQGFVTVAPNTVGERFIPTVLIPGPPSNVLIHAFEGWTFYRPSAGGTLEIEKPPEGGNLSYSGGTFDPNTTPFPPADGKSHLITANAVVSLAEIGLTTSELVFYNTDAVEIQASESDLMAGVIYTVTADGFKTDAQGQEEGDEAAIWNGEEYVEHELMLGSWTPLAPASADYRQYTDDALASLPTPVSGGGHIRITGATPVGGGSVGSFVMRGVAVDEATVVDTNIVAMTIRSSGDLVRVKVDDGAAVDIILPANGDVFQGTHDITLGGADTTVKVVYLSGDMSDGAVIEGSSDSIVFHKAVAPVITATLSGAYPISVQTGQPITALPAGNSSFIVSGTADKPVVALRILDQGAGQAKEVAFAASTNFSTTVVIANRGTTTQALPVHIQAKDENDAWSAVYATNSSGSSNGVHVVNLNNSSPSATVTIATSTGNQALKNTETATVALSNKSNSTMTQWSGLNGIKFEMELDDSTGVFSRVNLNSGDAGYVNSIHGYNITTNNVVITLTNGANGLTTSYSRNVKIAHADPIPTPNVPALPSSATGTSHTWNVAFDQQITNVSIEADPTLGDHFSGAATQPTATSARRIYQALDTSSKGQGTGTGTATNLAGKVINFNIPYSTKGYVARNSMVGPDNQLNYGIPKGFFTVFVQTTYDVSDAAAISATNATLASDLTVQRLSFNNETGVIVPVDTPSGTFVNSGVRVVASGNYDSANPPLGYSLRDGSGNALPDGTPFTLFEIHDYADVNGLGIPAPIEGISEAGEVL